MIGKLLEDASLILGAVFGATHLAQALNKQIADEPVTRLLEQGIQELQGYEGELAKRVQLCSAFSLAPLEKTVYVQGHWASQKGIQILAYAKRQTRLWKGVAKELGTWTFATECVVNSLAHIAKDRCLADDLLWAGVRGAISGAVLGHQMSEQDKKTQIALGVVTGFCLATSGSLLGAVAGKTARIIYKILDPKLDDKPLFPRMGGSVIALVAMHSPLQQPLHQAVVLGAITDLILQGSCEEEEIEEVT